MKNKLLLLFIFFSLIFISCEDYVTDVDPLIDAVEDERLSDPAQIPFLIKGVKTRFATTTDQLLLISDGLSDAFFFDSNVPNATFPTYEDIDVGDIQFDNNSVDNPFTDLGELRFFADDLVRRTNSLSGVSAEVEREALFTGYLYGGIARYYYATYFGLNPNEGGATIDNGPFIPSNQMYDLAIEKLTAALDYAADDAEARIVNSLIARTYLFKGDYTQAASYAANGMQEGDAPFEALYSLTQNNEYWIFAGALRAQYVIDYRFVDYVEADPKEANRIQYTEILGNDNETIYYYQTRYPQNTSPLQVMTWQENNLMRAELALRGAGSGDALALVNAVRASHELDPLANVDLDVIYLERDKELYCTGVRLPDQRRFGRWHLGPNDWHYFPLTQSERNNNPNL